MVDTPASRAEPMVNDRFMPIRKENSTTGLSVSDIAEQRE